MPDFTQLDITSLPLDTLVLLTLYFVAAVYAIFSAIFYYHWRTYAADTKVSTYTLIIYFSTTIPALLIMVILALVIT